METRVRGLSGQRPIPGLGNGAKESAPLPAPPVVVWLRFVGRSWGFSPNVAAKSWPGLSSDVGVDR